MVEIIAKKNCLVEQNVSTGPIGKDGPIFASYIIVSYMYYQIYIQTPLNVTTLSVFII